MTSDERVDDGLSAEVRLIFGECKGGDVMTVCRNLADMTLTVELESSDTQSVLLR
jgi:hypothetical protein